MSEEKDYSKWHELKTSLNNEKSRDLFFRERDIWFCSVGLNIGTEQDGKREDFERPVLVFKKFNQWMFWGIPLTSKIKNEKYAYTFEFKGKKSSAILTQLRLFDRRRLTRRFGQITEKDYQQLTDQFLEFSALKKAIPLNLSTQGISEPEGHSQPEVYQNIRATASTIYLDHAAATPLDPRVFEAMKPWLIENSANPSSIYQAGQQARAVVDEARMKVANFLGCKATEVYFTASGTESCNWALRGVLEQDFLQAKSPHLIVSSIEHSAILETAKYLQLRFGSGVTTLPVSEDGIIDVADLGKAIQPDTRLVSIMMVNNEIGTIQPIQELARICKERSVYLHTDACQAAGYLDLNVNELGVDLLTMNAGKISGPKGVGMLFVREGVNILPWTYGGGQEFKMRAGTENVAGIVGFGKAVELLQDGKNAVKDLRDKLWNELKNNIDGIELNGSLENRIDNNLNVFIPGVDGEMLVRRLDLQGISISSGSACASGTSEPSHVLLALGRTPEEAQSSIRITLGKENTGAEIEQFAHALSEAVSALKKP